MCPAEVLQYPGGLSLQLVLHDDQPQELHVGLHLVPVDVLDFVPGEFGLEAAVGQGDDTEALLGVVLQNIRKVLWNYMDRRFRKNIFKMNNSREQNISLKMLVFIMALASGQYTSRMT